MILKLIAVGILTLVSKIDDGAAKTEINPSSYPIPHRGSEVYRPPGSDIIADPYQWMEDPDSKETKQFVEEENLLTKEYFEKNSKYAKEIKARYAELWTLEQFEGPSPQGDKFFSYRSRDADKQEILYVHDEPVGNGREFLDPNKLGTGSSVTLIQASSAFSQDGKVFAYLAYDSEAKSNFIQFKHLEKEGIYKEKLRNMTNYKVVWVKNEGIIYMTYDLSNGKEDSLAASYSKTLRLYYHKLGTEQEVDFLVGELENDDHFSFDITDDCKYLIVSVYQGSKNIVLVANLDLISGQNGQLLEFPPLREKYEAEYEFVTNIGPQLIFRTNEDAPFYKLVSVDVSIPDSWKVVVPEDEYLVLDWAKPASNKYIVLAYIEEDMTSLLQLFEVATDSIKMTFRLPSGTVKAESFYSDKNKTEIYFKFVSFFTPCIIYSFDVNNLESSEPKKIKEIKVPNFNPVDYKVEFVEVPTENHMGTVPAHIIRKNNMKFEGDNFTFMTANGGFGAKLLPYFSVNRIVVLENLNGVHVVSYIRGGGELGERWHKDGSLHKKQNSINDFKAVAEYLVRYKYTKPELLAIDGGANGISGPLIGASINQNPQLFGVAIAEASLTDMIRFNIFQREWVYEYGSPQLPEDVEYLMKYSPLHHVKIDKIQYPATMVIAAAEDDRVPAFHSLKFIATLQNEARESVIQKNPLIFKEAGNSKTTLEEAVQIMMFIVMNTDIEFKL